MTWESLAKIPQFCVVCTKTLLKWGFPKSWGYPCSSSILDWDFPLQGGAPPVISWIKIPINYRYNPVITPSYWTYVHQLSDSELGHHLVRTTSDLPLESPPFPWWFSHFRILKISHFPSINDPAIKGCHHLWEAPAIPIRLPASLASLVPRRPWNETK